MRTLGPASTAPSITSITGFTDSMVPIRALAAPMRPPFLRFSRVSRVAWILVRAAMSSAMATISSTEAPAAPALAASMQMVPRPRLTDLESTARTGSSPARALAAVSAAWMVADSLDDRLMHTTPVAPAAAASRKACSKAPGEGAAVDGSTAEAADWAQKADGVRSRPSTNSSSPKRMDRGTTVMLCSRDHRRR